MPAASYNLEAVRRDIVTCRLHFPIGAIFDRSKASTSRAPGALRHLGREDESASSFSEEKDVNGLTWERFSAEQQAAEINTFGRQLLTIRNEKLFDINGC